MVRPKEADREQVRTKQLKVRLKPLQYERWAVGASREGQSLADWVRMVCDRAAMGHGDVGSLAADNRRLREACEIFQRYGLPPHDESGESEWRRAIELYRIAVARDGEAIRVRDVWGFE